VVIDAARRNGKVMALLLDRLGDQVTITEEVVMAAAGNLWNGKKVIALLLDQRCDQITITENVVMATTNNWRSRKEYCLIDEAIRLPERRSNVLLQDSMRK
jgi:hypothetical protein